MPTRAPTWLSLARRRRPPPGYFEARGHHINVNVLQRDMLVDAMEVQGGVPSQAAYRKGRAGNTALPMPPRPLTHTTPFVLPLPPLKHPERYPNLTIRVSGYAVHFTSLTREQQARWNGVGGESRRPGARGSDTATCGILPQHRKQSQ